MGGGCENTKHKLYIKSLDSKRSEIGNNLESNHHKVYKGILVDYFSVLETRGWISTQLSIAVNVKINTKQHQKPGMAFLIYIF